MALWHRVLEGRPMREDEKTKTNPIVEAAGTLIGLALVGAVALGILYIRGRANATMIIGVAVALGILAIVQLAGKTLRSGK